MFLAVDLSFLSQLNLVFYLILGFAILAGFIRGLKKTLFSFITMAIFYVVFFLTINQAVNFLWSFEMPWLGPILGNVDPSLSGFTSFEGSMETIIQFLVGDNINLTGASAEVTALATGLVQFVIKIVWTILYFTVILLIYKLICLIIRAIFFRSKKGESKNRLFGSIFGALNGIMAVFVMMIVLGGIMSVAESALTLIASQDQPITQSFDGRFDDYDYTNSVIPLADSTELDTYVDDLQGMIDGYKNNIFVKLADSITTASTINADVEVPLHIDLFDRVLSFEYNDKAIGFRYELAVFSSAGAILLESDFMDTNEITDLTGVEIRDFFAEISQSNLIVSLMPVAIEVAANSFDQDLDIDLDTLYAIDFEEELTNLGFVAGALFDILSGADFITGEAGEQININAESVMDIFDNIAGSEVIVLMTESLLLPMLEDSEGELATIFTVPDTFDIASEYLALGAIFAEIISADLNFEDFTNPDANVMLQAMSQIDLTVLLDSQLVTEALINILSGDAQIDGFDMLSIPDGVEWRDTDTEDGELRKILTALNSFFNDAGDVDFNNLTIDDLMQLSDEAIEDFFSSYIIRATVSDIITSTDLGDVPLVIPDTVYDDQDYFTEAELINVVKAIKLILSDVGSDFDIMKALALSDTEITTLLASDIIYATIGKEIYDLGTSTLVVPDSIGDSVVDTVTVDSTSVSVINRTEIRAILKALSVLEITDFDSMAFDASILSSLRNEAGTDLDDTKLDTLWDSKIIHATVSDMIIGLDVSNGGILVIPDLYENGDDLRFTLGTIEYLDTDEISNLMKALDKIGINNFDTMDFEDTSLLLNNLAVLLDSSIIHATITDIVMDLDGTVIIPERDINNVAILNVQGSFTYITVVELTNLLEALDAIGEGNPAAFSSSFDLSLFDEESEQDTVLASAIMHATISQKLFDLGDGILIIPDFEDDGSTAVTVERGSVGNLTKYIVKDELKAIINVFNELDLLNPDNITTEMSSADLLANKDLILASASLQATLSKQIIDGSDAILIPDSVLVDVGTITFIESSEMAKFIDSINTLGLGDLDGFSFTAEDILDIEDKDTFFDSEIMRATTSKYIIDESGDEGAAPGTTVLLVPTLLREVITEDGLNVDIIQKAELIKIFTAFEVMNITNFDDGVSATGVQDLTSEQLATILESGSFHVTIDNMLRGNNNINTKIPDLATTNLYGVDPLITDTEIIEFMEAVKQFSGVNFTDASFTVATISGLTPSQRDEVLDSMIVRNILTDELEATMLADDPFDLYWPANSDYMNSEPTTFLTEDGINAVLSHYSLI